MSSHEHTASCTAERIRICSLCGTRFESGIADPGPDDAPRCPQCGMWESEPADDPGESEFVVRRTTKFR